MTGVQDIRVFVVIRVRIYRDWLVDALSQQDGFEVAGVSHDGRDYDAITTALPDLVLMDMSSRRTANDMHIMRDIARAVPIVALAAFNVEWEGIACAEYGVAGLVPVEGSFDDVLAAMRAVNRGQPFGSQHIAPTVIWRIVSVAPPTSHATAQFQDRLTMRERQIVELIDMGMSNKEIAAELHIQLATVKNHVHHVLRKLGVSRRRDVSRRIREGPEDRRNARYSGGDVPVARLDLVVG